MQARRCGVVDTPKKFFGTIDQVFRWGFELGRSTSPRSNCQAIKAPLSPRRGFTFGAARAAGWLVEPNVLEVRFRLHLSDLARAVTKSETEAAGARARSPFP